MSRQHGGKPRPPLPIVGIHSTSFRTLSSFSSFSIDMPSYYDIDDFLAEEEAVPCRTVFDFSFLNHLHPDYASSTNGGGNAAHVLPEHSKIKMPLWAVRKWADLGFCRLLLPAHYRTRARELLQADPAAVTLRPRFFRSGHGLVQLIESSSQQNADILLKQPASADRNAQLQQLEAALQEARLLRETLLQVGPLRVSLHSMGPAVNSPILLPSDLYGTSTESNFGLGAQQCGRRCDVLSSETIRHGKMSLSTSGRGGRRA
jgi:hypothetical protein